MRMQKIKFKQQLGPYRPGEIREFPADRAALFIRDGQATIVEEKKPAAPLKPPTTPPPGDDQTKAPSGPPADKMIRDGQTVTK